MKLWHFASNEIDVKGIVVIILSTTSNSPFILGRNISLEPTLTLNSCQAFSFDIVWTMLFLFL